MLKSTNVFVFILLLWSCSPAFDGKKTSLTENDVLTHHDPPGFPKMVFPDDNALTAARVELGRRLFFDPILSLDSTLSCGSCHLPAHAFADTVAISRGVHHEQTGFRNSYSLANVGYQKALFMEGGVPSLELQALAPLGEESEMDFSIHQGAERMKRNADYVSLSKKAYDREPHGFVITRSLSAFQRSLISADSPYDRYMRNEGDHDMSEEALAGMAVFESSGCANCHSGALFTDQRFHNIGLYEEYADNGRRRLTRLKEDEGRFKTPSLRNVEVTAPYMHDGLLVDLDEVISHFESGGKSHWNKSATIVPQTWTVEEKKQLKAFLCSLTDSTFINKRYY